MIDLWLSAAIINLGFWIGVYVTRRLTGDAMQDAWQPWTLLYCADCRLCAARCGKCFYRPPVLAAPHRPGWRYRCLTHRALARLHVIPQGPDGAL